MGLSPDKARRVLETADLVCPADVIAGAVRRLAAEITSALSGSFPLVLCVMRGGVVFAGQLLPQLRFPLELDYLEATRYGNAIRGGEIAWRVSPSMPVTDRAILVLDDVLDEGSTLAAIRENLVSAGARRVYCAVFCEKQTGRPKPVQADFTGVRLPDRFLFGYGMDVRGAWRNLPEIYAITESLD